MVGYYETPFPASARWAYHHLGARMRSEAARPEVERLVGLLAHRDAGIPELKELRTTREVSEFVTVALPVVRSRKGVTPHSLRMLDQVLRTGAERRRRAPEFAAESLGQCDELTRAPDEEAQP